MVYAADVSSPFYEVVRTLRDKGLKGEIVLCVCPQVLNEFFAVVTNPRRVTHPIAPQEAMEEVKKYLRSAHILKMRAFHKS